MAVANLIATDELVQFVGSSGSDQLCLHFVRGVCMKFIISFVAFSKLPCGGREVRDMIQSDCFVVHDPQVSSVSDVLDGSCGSRLRNLTAAL